MRFLLKIHFALSLFFSLLLGLVFDLSVALSFAAGSFLMLGNLVVMSLVWPLILAKKQVALSTGVIVFKFAILTWIIFLVATGKTIQVGWFAVGLSLVVVSAVITAFKTAATSSSSPEEDLLN